VYQFGYRAISEVYQFGYRAISEVYQFGYRAISESIPSMPTFQQILNDVKIRKENLERSYK
jgi:hypothetical protein